MAATKEDINGLTELILGMQTTLQEQFESIDQRFEAIDRRFEVFESSMGGMATKEDIDRIHVVLDGIASRLEIDDHERVAASAQVERHEGWIEKAAPVVGVPYSVTG